MLNEEMRPRFSDREAECLAAEFYGLQVVASGLPSDRDQNFALVTAEGERYVLKIANGGENHEMLVAQQQGMALAGEHLAVIPEICRALTGETLVEAVSARGVNHSVWMIGFLPGRPLGEMRHRSVGLLEDLGRSFGRLDHHLAGFDHPALHRDFEWDLANGVRTVRERLPLIEDVGLRDLVSGLTERFEREAGPRLADLRRSAIHNDLNDYNLLVGDGGERVTGIVDFGDMVLGWTVGDLAIALAYILLDEKDPLTVASRVVAGYHAENRLTETEVGVLFGLITLRICVSVAMAAHQHRLRPDDQYLVISQEPIRRTLPRLAAIPWRLAEAALRQACGMEPMAGEATVGKWLRERAGSFHPVVPVDWQRDVWTAIDLGVGSSLIEGDPTAGDERRLTARIGESMRAAGAMAGVGGYDEARLLYSSPLFAGDGGLTDERRTIHLGIDIFMDAGVPVSAPLAGQVAVVANNSAPLDYGPVIILEHQADGGQRFFTLYGHLSTDSLEGRFAGQEVAAGERIGAIGEVSVNGGWTPHLHFQVITDLLGLGGDFPGVCRASERGYWREFSPDPAPLLGLPEGRLTRHEPAKAETLAVRRRRLGGNLSIGYREPVKVLRGWRQYLFDETGRRYVDAYNNVPHVGHCHPRVVEAGARQMAILNTNTRYLHDLINEYAARICATLPETLSVCYFVNSASEANDLALRLARTHTGARDLIVLESAYHGHTTGLIDISPYKHDGPGGSGAPDWIHTAPIPDLYRGAWRTGDPLAAERYAARVGEIIDGLRRAGRGLCGYIAETCPSVGGQIFMPPGYLPAVYREVHSAGGVCIADEVQTGYGRIGTHFWAFEAHDVIPDIVVMGKPIGNGHPIGAVVTTPEIAASFNNGMEFFSTFGGNPVSCAIGLAVLDVLRDEGLQEHARIIGERLLAGLRPLVDRFPLVGDVRGSGLFLGIELVRDRELLTPAADEASHVANRLREEGVLLGTDGPHHNVVKIRPPMPFDDVDADLLIDLMNRVIAEIS